MQSAMNCNSLGFITSSPTRSLLATILNHGKEESGMSGLSKPYIKQIAKV
jgi:hypothetical protein